MFESIATKLCMVVHIIMVGGGGGFTQATYPVIFWVDVLLMSASQTFYMLTQQPAASFLLPLSSYLQVKRVQVARSKSVA